MTEDLTRSCAVIVMGVSASGKTSVGEAIAARLTCTFIDGDDLHPAANVQKMAAGTPLGDEDRWPWLDRVGAVLADRAMHPEGVVVACSALRRVYRDRIRAASAGGATFVFLEITRGEAARRSALRRNHFMPPSLIESQFETLEAPFEEPDVVTVGASDSIEAVAERATVAIRTRLERIQRHQ